MKKAPKKGKIKGYAYGTNAQGVMAAGVAETDLSKARKYAGKKKGTTSDYLSDYAKIMGDRLLTTVGAGDVIDDTYKTQLGTKASGILANLDPLQESAGKVVLNAAMPGAGTAVNAAGKMIGGSEKAKRMARRPNETEEMYQLRMAQEMNSDTGSTAMDLIGASGLLEKGMEYGLGSLKNGGIVSKKKVQKMADGGPVGEEKKPVLKPTAADAKAHLKRSEEIEKARTILNAELVKKLGVKSVADIPAEAVLAPEDVSKLAPDYYKQVAEANRYYQKYGTTPYDVSGTPIPTVAGTGEEGASYYETAYGPRHRAIVYPKLQVSPTVTPAGTPVVPTKKKVVSPVDTTNAPILGFKNGGKIEGAGSAKSDSIKANVEKGAFVVPEENAEVAEEIREKYLGDDSEEKANLNQGGGVPVKLSDGEHLFTKQEKEFLMKMGVDLAKLAPNSKNGNAKADGGEVGGDDLAALLKKLDEQERQLEAKKKQADIERAKEKDTAKKASLKFAMNRANEAEQKRLSKIKAGILKDMEAPRGYDVADLKRRVKNYQEELNASESIHNVKNYKEGATGGYHYVPPKGDGVKAVSAEAVKKNIESTESPIGVPGAVAPIAKKSWAEISKEIDTKKAEPIAATKKGAAKSISKEEKAIMETLPIRQARAMQLGKQPTKAGEFPVTEAEPTIKGNVTDINALVDAGRGRGVEDEINVPGIEEIFGGAQVGMGLLSLLGDGKRPEDVIDPDFAAAVESAKAEAQYGLTPANRVMAEEQLLQRARAGEDIIRNLSGGNAGIAMSNLRAASADTARDITSLAATDENLRLEKARYAGAMVGRKAAMKRELFQDKMDAFEQNQVAGAELLGAGLENILGSVRAKREQTFLENLSKTATPTFNF